MPTLQLAACGPVLIDNAEAVRVVLGYARARRWHFVQTPSHPTGHWVRVRVPAYPFSTFDVLPPSEEPGFTWADLLAPDGLLGPLSKNRYNQFSAEVKALAPAVEAAMADAHGRPFWELDEGGCNAIADVLSSARASSDPDRVAAVLHRKHPTTFPLLTTHTERAHGPLARARRITAVGVIHADLVSNDQALAALVEVVTQHLGVQLGRLRLYDLLVWLTTTRRWADCRGSGS